MKLKGIVLYDRARPHAIHEVVLGDELATRLNQNLDDFEREIPDRDGNPSGAQFTLGKINLPLARLVHQFCASRGHLVAPVQVIFSLLRFRRCTREARLTGLRHRCRRWRTTDAASRVEIVGRIGVPGNASEFLRDTQLWFRELIRLAAIRQQRERGMLMLAASGRSAG
jgi:hypothetical protein